MYTVMHISHTDILSDARIMKEISSLKSVGRYVITAIGFGSSWKKDQDAVIYPDPRLPLAALPRMLGARAIIMLITFSIISAFILMYEISKKRPNIVHVHDNLLLAQVCFLSLIFKFKIIYDAHELESNKNGQLEISKKLVKLTELICARRVDLLITVSESIRDWYSANYNIKRSLVVCNYPVIKTGYCESENKKFRDIFNIPEQSTLFLYLGLQVPGRSVLQVVDAFKKLDERHQLILLGSGDYHNTLLEVAEVFRNVHVYPQVPHTDVVALATSCDVGLCLIENVSLSDYFSLPNKLFEYINADLFVIGSDFPEIRTVLEESGTRHLVVAPDEELTEAITRVADLVNIEKGIPSNGISRRSSVVSWSAAETVLLAGYKEIEGC